MKRFGVLLALLMLGSLFAAGMKNVKADTVTQYYLDIAEDVNSVQLVLNSTTWSAYTPNIVSVVETGPNSTRIYFSSEKDLIRFLIPPDLKSSTVFPFDKIRSSIALTVLHVHYHSPGNGGRTIGKVVNLTEVASAYGSAIIYNGGGSASIQDLSGNALVNSGQFAGSFVKTDGYQFYISDQAGDFKFPDYDFWLVFVSGTIKFDWSASGGTLTTYHVQLAMNRVFFNIKNALTGQSLNNVTIREGNTTLGIIDDGDSLELTKGTHTLTFEKSGYWSVTKTIDVQNDTSVSVELYPDNYVIIASAQVSDVYQYSQGVATLQVSVVNGSGYGYSTKVAISGVEVTKVTWNGAIVNPGDDGKYYLGDITSGSGELKIYFKVGDVLGDRSFRVTFTTYDSLANLKANEYMITYTVQEPPFKVILPSWRVGVNTVRVTDQSGTDRVISIILYDENGTEVYSDSQSLLSYGSVEFNVPINALSGYILEVRSNDGISLYFDVTAQVPIVLKTETVQVSGSSGAVTVEVSNSGSSVAYYKFVVEGEPVDNSTPVTEVSLAPGETKTVQVPFKLKEGLTLENYEATIKALDSSDMVVWSSTFIIKRSSGFALPISGASAEDLVGMGAVAVLGLGGLALVLRKRRR